jgi:UPF0716 family protein affecting phage T7 exclusion
VWFVLGFADEKVYPFWQGFLLLFGLGVATSVLVSLLTRPESIETLREFHRRCRPPGFWGPVTRELSATERHAIAAETRRDLADCVLGIAFAASVIVSVISPMGRHWTVFAGALLIALASGGAFITRWSRRGVFRALDAAAPVTVRSA